MVLRVCKMENDNSEFLGCATSQAIKMHDECFQSNSLQIVPPSQNHVRFNSDIVAYPSQSISAINRNDLEQQRVGNKNSQQEIIEYMKKIQDKSDAKSFAEQSKSQKSLNKSNNVTQNGKLNPQRLESYGNNKNWKIVKQKFEEDGSFSFSTRPREPKAESIHSLSFGSSALTKLEENPLCDYSQDSISSIEYFSDNSELGSYLENRGRNSFPIYTRSKDRRASDTSFLSYKDRRTSDTSYLSGKYFTPDESPNVNEDCIATIIELGKKSCHEKKTWKQGVSFIEEEEGENFPFLLSNSESETEESSSITAIEIKNRTKKIKDNLRLFIPQNIYDEVQMNNDTDANAEKSLESVNNLENLLHIPLNKQIEEYPKEEAIPEISMNKWRTVVINVGGVDYRSKIVNFQKYPASRLGKIFRATSTEEILLHCDGYVPGNPPVIYFDRNDQNFSAIIDCYRMEELHICGLNCALVMQEDLAFWGIDELFLEPCCSIKYFPHIVGCQNELDEENIKREADDERQNDENFGQTLKGKIRTHIWNFLEYPETSKGAQAWAFMSLFMVCVSTVTFVVGTNFEGEEEKIQSIKYANSTEYSYEDNEFDLQDAIEIIDNIAVMFFTLEYVLRLIVSPKKVKFISNKMNFIDFMAIAPFFLSAVLAGLEDMQVIGKAGKIIRLVRIMRIMRIFKMVRHFAGLQSLVYTLQQAYKELGLLFLLVAVAILLYTSLIFAVEREGPDAELWSFYDSFWWGLMTLTTVGYNITPVTFFGKFICGMCAVTGIFILTLPIPIVVTSFASCYKNRLWRNEISMKKRIISAQTKENNPTEKRNLFADLAGQGGFYINQCNPDDDQDSNTSVLSLTPSPNDFSNVELFDTEMGEKEPFIEDINFNLENVVPMTSPMSPEQTESYYKTTLATQTALDGKECTEDLKWSIKHTDV